MYKNVLQDKKNRTILWIGNGEGGDRIFTWVKGSVYALILTLYPNDITLNNSATSYLEDVYWAMIGLGKDNLKLGICPVTEQGIDLHLVSMDRLHKVSIGKGYARTSNKMIIKKISDMISQPINGLKINAAYDETEDMLIADLHELAADKR